MARMAWMRGLTALSGCLFVGCLFHRPGDLPPPERPGNDSPAAALPGAPEQEESPLSNYHPRPVARKAGSVEPTLEQVNLKVGPAPEILTPPATKEPSPEPPAPPPDAPLVSALRCALEKHPDESRHLLEQYDQSDRELILSLIRLLAGFDGNQVEKMSAEELSRTLEHLRSLGTQFRPRVPLKLDKVCFCKKIEGFGQYDPLAIGHEFSAGSDGQPGERVQVYAEVRNFSSAVKQEQYETRLSSSLEILDEDRRPVATMTPETTTDLSQTPRQDYFLNFQFHVPAKLTPGLYTLWVTVRDMTPEPAGQKKRPPARRSLDFRVGPPSSSTR